MVNPVQPIFHRYLCFQGHGLEIETWSDLPVGSGMGTSSILAGCVLSALWTAVGTSYSLGDLNHAVMIEINGCFLSLICDNLLVYFLFPHNITRKTEKSTSELSKISFKICISIS